jgi:hypothetical protein
MGAPPGPLCTQLLEKSDLEQCLKAASGISGDNDTEVTRTKNDEVAELQR